MIDYNSSWDAYYVGSYNNESYYKRYGIYWVRRSSTSGGDLRDRLYFAGFSRPSGLVDV